MSNKIRMTKGDTHRMRLAIVMSNGQEYNLKSGDSVTLTVKKPFCSTVAIQKTVTSGDIAILPSDTQNMSIGYYEYDVQLNLQNGEVHTIIKPTPFELMREITTSNQN